MKDPLVILELSPKSVEVVRALQAGSKTPVDISKVTSVSRPAIYEILERLENRGLVKGESVRGKKQWRLSSNVEIQNLIAKAVAEITGNSEERNTPYESKEVGVFVYRGTKAIRDIMRQVFQTHKGETCIGIQGENVYSAWKKLLGVETINEINRDIKANGMINQAIVPVGHFTKVIHTMGEEWARNFEGRAYRVNEIDEEYFNHSAEIFLFKDSVYLLSMSESLVIEIKNSEIQKMILSLLHYVQNTSRVIDGNEMLRNLLAK